MVHKGRISIGSQVVPNLMTPGSMPVESKAKPPQALGDDSVSETSESAHSCTNHDRTVEGVSRNVKLGFAEPLALCPGLNQPPCHIASDLKGLGNRPSLGNETLDLVRGCQINALRQLLQVVTSR